MDEKIEIKVTLSEKQKKELEELLIDCEKKEQKKPDFFIEQEWNEIPDCPCFFLLYTDKQLVSAASIFIIENEAELSAITQVEKRRKGFFSKILHVIFSVLAEYNITKINIRIEKENYIGQQILEHWKWKKGNTDYLMELLPKEIEKLQHTNTYNKKRNTQKIKLLNTSEIIEKKEELIKLYTSAFQYLPAEAEWIFENNLSEGMDLWVYCVENHLTGLCFVSKTKQTYFLSSISIRKQEQHQGHGEYFLKKLLIQLWEQKTNNVLLQVSGENHAAIGLYKKLGFSFKQQLNTYFLDFK